MQKFFRIPLLFLFLASLMGIFLRLQLIAPTPGINYTFVLHGHSHVMFLGWVFNMLYLGFVQVHISKSHHPFFRKLFIVLQLLVLGMMISFPLQGYGFYSILFSTLHTLAALLFIAVFFRKTKAVNSISFWYTKTALIFFAISNLGPFVLGYLMSAGLGQSKWYYLTIYFYLHFQYNGFFIFGIFSLFIKKLEWQELHTHGSRSLKKMGYLMAVSCVFAYILSALWTQPGLAFNIIGGLSAMLQLYAFALLIQFLKSNKQVLQQSFDRLSRLILSLVLFFFGFKLVLQLLSAFPEIATFAYELRPIIIAYLHLVLVGVVTLFLAVWYLTLDLVKLKTRKKIFALFIVAFSGMEICLVLMPWSGRIESYALLSLPHFILIFSTLLAISFLMMLSAKRDKNHVLN